MSATEQKGYLVPVKVTCTMEVYVEAVSATEARRLAREGEWDEPGELQYAYPVRAIVAGPVREQ